MPVSRNILSIVPVILMLTIFNNTSEYYLVPFIITSEENVYEAVSAMMFLNCLFIIQKNNQTIFQNSISLLIKCIKFITLG